MAVTVWKEAGFFMIFYLAALQSMSPHLAEAASIEGASRWYFFRRVTFPLLMPTTLFVLVNAVINAFRLVDHIVVMTRGGPDNATALLLYYIYEIGFRFWDSAYAAALTMVLLVLLGLVALVQFVVPRAPDALPMSASLPPPAPSTSARSGFGDARWRTLGRVAARRAVGAAARCTRSGRRSTRPSSRRGFALSAPLTLDNFVKAWHAAPFARYFLNTVILVTMVLAAQLVLVTLAAYAFARFEFPGRNVLFALVLVQLMIMPDVLIVENYRTMTRARPEGHDPRDRAAVHGERVRHLPAAPDVQDGPARARRGGARRRLHAAADAVEGLRAARAPDVPRLRAGVGVATTGTISSGRSSSPTRSSRGR